MRLHGVLPYLLPLVSVGDGPDAAAAAAVPIAPHGAAGFTMNAAGSGSIPPSGHEILEIRIHKGKCAKGALTPQPSHYGMPSHPMRHHKQGGMVGAHQMYGPSYCPSHQGKVKLSVKHKGHRQHAHGACPCSQQSHHGMPPMPSMSSHGFQHHPCHPQGIMSSHQHNLASPYFSAGHKRSGRKIKIKGLGKQHCFHGHCQARQTQNKFERRLRTLQAQYNELSQMIKSTAVTHEMRTLMKRYLDRLQKKISKVSMRAQLERQQSELYVTLLDPSLTDTMRQALRTQLEMLRRRIAQLSQRMLVGVEQKRMIIKQHIKELEKMLTSKALSPGARRELNSHLKRLHQQLMLLERQAVMEHQRSRVVQMLQQDNLNAIMRDALNMQLKHINDQIHRLTHKPKKVSPAQKRQKALKQQQKYLTLLFNDPNTAPNVRQVLKQQLDTLNYQGKQIAKQFALQKQMTELNSMLKSPSSSPSMRQALQSQLGSLQKQMKLAKAPRPIHKVKKVIKKGGKKIAHKIKKGAKKGVKKIAHKAKKGAKKAKKGIKKIAHKAKKVAKKGAHGIKKAAHKAKKLVKRTARHAVGKPHHRHHKINRIVPKAHRHPVPRHVHAKPKPGRAIKKIGKAVKKAGKKTVKKVGKGIKRVVKAPKKAAHKIEKAAKGTAKAIGKELKGAAKGVGKILGGPKLTSKVGVEPKQVKKAEKKIKKKVKKAGKKLKKADKKMRKAAKKAGMRSDSFSSDSDDDFF